VDVATANTLLFFFEACLALFAFFFAVGH
jgi:hypothetical protein